jgi:hypothetical protein
MEALGGRGGIAPTHSWSRHWMKVSGQRHAPAALYPREEDLRYPSETGGWVGLRAGLDTDALCLCRGSSPGRLVVQFVVRHCSLLTELPGTGPVCICANIMFDTVHIFDIKDVSGSYCTSGCLYTIGSVCFSFYFCLFFGTLFYDAFSVIIHVDDRVTSASRIATANKP